MKELFYRFAPVTLGLIGLCITIVLYLLTLYLKGFEFWVSAAVIAFLCGSLVGGLLRNFRHSAYTDPLTGLWNRRYFNMRLMEEMERTKRSDSPLCIALIDTDNFKGVNDSYGHVAGDELLSEIAKTMRHKTRAFDIIARWGGDEFAIIFPDTTTDGALVVAERIRLAVSDNKNTYNVTLSIGVLAVDGKTSLRRTLELVDHALYKSKKKKNETTVWKPCSYHDVCRA